MAASLCSTACKTNACWNSLQSLLTTHRNRHKNKTKTFELGIWVRHHRKFSCKYLKKNSFSDIIRVPFNHGRGSAPLIDALTNRDVGAPLRGAFRLYLVYKSHGCQVEQTKTRQVKGQRFHFQPTDISSSYKFSHAARAPSCCWFAGSRLRRTLSSPSLRGSIEWCRDSSIHVISRSLPTISGLSKYGLAPEGRFTVYKLEWNNAISICCGAPSVQQISL